MRFGIDIERVGDEAVTIARRARRLNRHPDLPETHALEPLFEAAFGMFRDALRAFSDGDVDLAADVKARDGNVDRMEADIAMALTDQIEQNPDRSRDLIDLILVGRNLERVGDHAKNISEQVVFAVSGVELRHRKEVR
jgi:phosphate transport system protein